MSYVRDETPVDPATWARLCVVAPRELVGVHPLPATVTLGRDARPGGLHLPHGTVSRRHLEIRAEGRETFVASDLGSRNGSWINAVPVDKLPRMLRSGDVLRLGEVVGIFEQGRGSLQEQGATSTEAIVGSSAAAIELRSAIARAAADSAPVLVIGDSGTGKESVARELHRLSARSGALIIANCATLSSNLADSQLFGHERGAFTGAVKAQPGLFRSADGGSLFLDEIGELPLELQPKLLRAVERGEIVPLGDTRTLTVDTRIIAATHRDIAAAVESGSFRRDLYARLSLLRIRVPRLAERRADLLVWIDVLHRRWLASRQADGDAPLEFSAEALEALLLHPWPENLRGLDHMVHELATGAPTDRITKAQVAAWSRPAPSPHGGALGPGSTPSTPTSAPPTPTPTPTQSPAPAPPRMPRPPKPSRDELLVVLEAHGWNLRAVARHYARDRRQIYRWLDAFGIERQR